MSRIQRTTGNSHLHGPPRLFPRFAAAFLILLALALLLRAWMGSAAQRMVEHDASRVEDATSTIGILHDQGPVGPLETSVGQPQPGAAPGRESLDSITSRTLSLRVVLEESGIQEPFLGNGVILYRPIGSVSKQLWTAPVRNGVFRLASEAPVLNAHNALFRGILIERLEAEAGWSALPDEPYLDLNDGDASDAVLFVRGTAWVVRVVDGNTGREIKDLAILRVRDGGWNRGEFITPPSNAAEIERPIIQGSVELDPVLDQHSTFWFGATGYSWSAYGVQRRGLLGQVVELQPASSIEIACSGTAPGCTLRARLLSTITATYGEKLGEWSGEPGGDLTVPLVAPGTYILSMLAYCPGDRTLVSDQEITLEAGETRRVLFPCDTGSGDLTVVIAGEERFLDGSEPAIEPFLPLGGGGFDRERLGSSPPETLRQEGRLTLRYRSLPQGTYILRLGDFVWLVVVESSGDNVHELRLGPGEWRELLFVDDISGSPLEVGYAGWCLVLDDVDPPTGSILPSTDRRGRGHVLTLDLPPGELRLFLAGSFGTFYTSVTIRVEESVYAVSIPTPHVLDVLASDGFPSHTHGGYWLDFGFRDEEQGPYPASEIGYAVRPKDGGGLIVSFTFRQAAPTEVFVPPMPAVGMVRGQWLALPWGDSKRLNLGLDGDRLNVGR